MLKILYVTIYLGLNFCFAQNEPVSSQMSLDSVNTTTKNIPFDDLSIVVFSCDKYQELWGGFFELLFKNWPSLKSTNSYIPIYLVSNSKRFDDPRVVTIKNENEKSWSDNALTVLATIKTKYVFSAFG